MSNVPLGFPGNFNNNSRLFQDYITLAGAISPGVARLVSFSAPRGWEIRKMGGFSGAVIVYTGDELAEMTFRLELWHPPDLDVQWQLFSSLLAKPPKGIAPTALATFALGLGYPLLNASPIDIDAVVVRETTPWDCDDDMLWSMQIKLLQFRAPLPAMGKPNKAIPAVAVTPPTPQDPTEVLIQQKSLQLAALLGP